jgi:Na+/H+ antiporter NhaD/arsenite permease-like protein
MRPPSPIELVPFGAMLLSISVLPSFAPRRWAERKFRLAWALSLAVPSVALSVARGAGPRVVHAMSDYVDLVALMSALVVISGGIVLAGTLEGTPAVNVVLLAIGAVLAPLIGAPGASTLMIRPYLHANRRRDSVAHGVIFLIMLSANIGGLLLPVGPPLYLGYLAGVPFLWTLTLWREWVFVVGLVLIVFFAWDRRHFRREGFIGEDQTRTLSAVRLLGTVNLPILLAAILSAALLSGPLRPFALVLCAVLSWRITPPGLHERNRFTFEPIEEIVVIFFAIFATISPALELLSLHAGGLSVSTPRAFFWASGGF